MNKKDFKVTDLTITSTFGVAPELAQKIKASIYKTKELKKVFPAMQSIEVDNVPKDEKEIETTMTVVLPGTIGIDADTLLNLKKIVDTVFHQFLEDVQTSLVYEMCANKWFEQVKELKNLNHEFPDSAES